jgi:3-methyladenine DNA glycosylase AlkD
MHSYIKPLVQLFESHSNVANAGPMAKYMRNQFPFLGIKSPERRTLAARFFREYGSPQLQELPLIIVSLWELPEREYQYFAVDLLDKRLKQLSVDYIGLLEQLITDKSWWDTVDGIATNLAGGLLRIYPGERDRYINSWRLSDNFWLRRTAILFQLNYKQETDAGLLYRIISENSDSPEFFIQKAIGWALREFSKTDSASVTEFVAQTELPSLSRREALKWLKSRKKSG